MVGWVTRGTVGPTKWKTRPYTEPDELPACSGVCELLRAAVDLYRAADPLLIDGQLGRKSARSDE